MVQCGKGQQSFVKTQDTESLETPNELVGCPNRSMASRDPAKGPAETQNLCQNRETTERRELWRRHRFLALRGQVRLGGGGED